MTRLARLRPRTEKIRRTRLYSHHALVYSLLSHSLRVAAEACSRISRQSDSPSDALGGWT